LFSKDAGIDVTTKCQADMKPPYFIPLILYTFVYSTLAAQTQNQIDSFKQGVYEEYNKEGIPTHYLGHFYDDSASLQVLTLNDTVNIDTPSAIFCLVLTVKDSALYGVSRGGQNNFLWTQNVTRRIDNGTTYFFVTINWSYKDYRRTQTDGYHILGTFSVQLYKPNEHIYRGISFRLQKLVDK
jgi:hypothetical protein